MTVLQARVLGTGASQMAAGPARRACKPEHRCHCMMQHVGSTAVYQACYCACKALLPA